MKKTILILFLLPILIFSQQENKAHFDSLITSGIHQIYNIQFDDAEITFNKLLDEYPGHPAGKFFDAMILWWKILLDFNNTEYDDRFVEKIDSVIDLCDEILDEDSENLDALFFKGGALGFRGRLYAFRKSWFDAAMDGKEALPIVHRAYTVDPDNKDVQLGFGIYNYYAATIPEKYPMVEPFMFFFPEGDKETGLNQLAEAAKAGRYSSIEARFTLLTIYQNFEEKPTLAYPYAVKLTTEFPNNPLFNLYLGRVFVKWNRYAEAKGVYENIIAKCDSGLTGYSSWSKREALYYIGLYHKRKNKIEEAIKIYTECNKLSAIVEENRDEETGFYVNSVLYLAQLYQKKGDTEKVKQLAEQLLDMRNYSGSHKKAEQLIEALENGGN